MSVVKNSGYQQCSKCVMDTSDPLITFDDDGVCNHCSHFAAVTSQQWKPGADGEAYLHQYFEQAKRKTHKREYDCIIGLGVEVALRPLVVHIDAGSNLTILRKLFDIVILLMLWPGKICVACNFRIWQEAFFANLSSSCAERWQHSD